MSDDIPVLPSEPVPRVDAQRPVAVVRGKSGSGPALLIGVLALALAGVALWVSWRIERGQAGTEAAIRAELSTRVDELTRNADQRKRDLDSLRARLADADGVNKSVREELIALGERSRRVEDAVANLADQRLTGRDALAMNEAEFLLQQGQERLALFNDAQAALAAYKLADSALAAAEDPVFASVRQTIAAETQALQASKPIETAAALAALERIRAGLPALADRTAPVAENSAPSRWQSFLAQFVRVSHSGDIASVGSRDLELTRALVAIDLRTAEAALLARDGEGFKAALARAKVGIGAGFDADSAAAKTTLAELDRLADAAEAPAIPELGSALKELRNLRATRALSQPSRSTSVPPAPAIDAPAHAGDGT